MRPYWIVFLVMISLVLAGCAPSQPAEEELPALDPQALPQAGVATNTPENPLQFKNTQEPQEMPATLPPVEKFVALAKKDLSARLQTDADGIELVKTTEITWPNAALGCPSPGKVYPQGKVPGYQIRLEAGGIGYVYNTDLVGQIILCPQIDPDNPNGSSPTTSGPTPEIGVPIK